MSQRPYDESVWCRGRWETRGFLRDHWVISVVFLALGQAASFLVLHPFLPSEELVPQALELAGTIIAGGLLTYICVSIVMLIRAPLLQRNEFRQMYLGVRDDLKEVCAAYAEKARSKAFKIERDEPVPLWRSIPPDVEVLHGEIMSLKVTNLGTKPARFVASCVWVDARRNSEQSTAWDGCWMEGAELKTERRIYPGAGQSAYLHVGLIASARRARHSGGGDRGGVGGGKAEPLELAGSQPGAIEDREWHSSYPIDEDDRLRVTVSRDDSPEAKEVEVHVYRDDQGAPEYEVTELPST